MDAKRQQQWFQDKVAASKFDTFWINFVLAPVPSYGPHTFDSKPLDQFCEQVNKGLQEIGVMHLVKRMTNEKRIPSCTVLVQFMFAMENMAIYQSIEERLKNIDGHVRMSCGLGWFGVTERIVRNQNL